jgi:diguanylate cyclase (GGDEF)-like protein
MQEADNEKATVQMDDAVRGDAQRRYNILETEPDEPYGGLVRLASHICDMPIAAVAMFSDDRQWFKGAVGLSVAEAANGAGFAGRTMQRAIEAEMTHLDIIEDTSPAEYASNIWVAGDPHIRFYAGAPLLMSGNIAVGALFVADLKPRKLGEAEASALCNLAQHVVSTIETRTRLAELEKTVVRQRKEEEDLKAQVEQIHSYSRELQVHAVRLEAINARLEALAKLDGMTGLKNHRAFQERLEFEFQRAMRYSMPLSLLLLDVDKFKQFNDTFGHLAGDEVLKTVAQVLQDNARGVDFVARYGGEEFVVILPHADEAASVAIGDRLRAAIENVVWPLRSVTASFGISTLTQAMTHASDLIALADKALYGSKTAGRNRVTHCIDMGNDAK